MDRVFEWAAAHPGTTTGIRVRRNNNLMYIFTNFRYLY